MADRENLLHRLKRESLICDTGYYARVPSDLLDEVLEFLKGSQWVSVKDQMPRTGRSVLVYVRRDDGGDTWYRTIAWMGEKNWDSCDPYFSAKDTITHWMPLPEPPKGDDE